MKRSKQDSQLGAKTTTAPAPAITCINADYNCSN